MMEIFTATPETTVDAIINLKENLLALGLFAIVLRIFRII